MKATALLESEAQIPLHSTDNTAVTKTIEHRLTSFGEKDVKVKIEKTAKSETTYASSSTTANPITNWIYNLYADFTNWTEKISIRKEIKFKEIDTSVLKNAPEAQKENVTFSEMSKLFNSDFDSYKRLSTADTIEETSHIIKKIADVYAENIPGLVITEDSTNMQDQLKVNDNKIQLGFQYKTNAKKTIDITVNNITDTENNIELSTSY